MNNYQTTAGRITRWYLTEWEQQERVEYRQKTHMLAATVGACVGCGVAYLLIYLIWG